MIPRLIALLLIASVGLATERADPYRQPGVRELMSAVTFYLSFDEGLMPDLAAGDKYTPKVHGNYARTHKRPALAPGLLGRALVLGTGSAMYPAQGNAALARRGAMAFWIRPEQWKRDKDGNCVFIYAGRHFVVERQGPLPGPDGRPRRRACILCIGSGKGQKRATSIAASDLKSGVWHFFVVNWSWPRLELSIDAAAPMAKATAGPPPSNAFPWFSVGSRGGSRALMDELLIFRRPLTPAEIQSLYESLRPLPKETVLPSSPQSEWRRRRSWPMPSPACRCPLRLSGRSRPARAA